MKTPITYYGGKQKLADIIIKMMPEHKIYCEPFFGGGAVFFSKEKSYLEVINDKNDKLMTFYRMVQCRFEDLQAMINQSLHSESDYKVAKDIYHGKKDVSDLEVAWSVWMVTNCSFSGTPAGGWKWCNGSAGSHTAKVPRHKREEFTCALKTRLQDVQISCRDAIKVINNRDTDKTFFYLDPPYPGADQKHYRGYTRENLEELLDTLSRIKGKFILSNFNSETLDIYIYRNNWIKTEITMPCLAANMGKAKIRQKTEVLVRNYKED